jgi:membrane protein DedA with SNARE-associated domain
MFDLLTGWIATGGYPALAALMVLENLLPPIPSELIVPLAGFNAAQGLASLWGVVVVATVGSVAGATIWYLLGRAWGEAGFLRFVDRHGLWLTISRPEAEAALAWFRRHGPKAVFLGRMVPTVRTLISVPAGISGMPLGPFLIWTTAGSFVWITGLAVAGYLLGAQYKRVEDWLNPVATLVVALIGGLYLWRLARGLWARRRG